MSDYSQIGREGFKMAQRGLNQHFRAIVDSGSILTTTKSLSIIPQLDLKHNLKQLEGWRENEAVRNIKGIITGFGIYTADTGKDRKSDKIIEMSAASSMAIKQGKE